MNASYIRINQLIQKLPISKASIWRKVKNKTFPAPIKLSVGITAWHMDDIEFWLAARQKGARHDPLLFTI